MPRVGPTTPGLPDPPAQPDTNAAKNKLAVAAIQARRRRGVATTNTTNATSSRRVCTVARSRGKSRGESRGTRRTVECDGAVVVTVVVTVTGASSVKEAGADEQLPAGIELLQVTVTEPLNPPDGVKVSGKLAACPAAIVAEVEPPGGTEMVMSVPSPDRVTACGLPGALSEIVTAPARAPVAVGVNVTVIVQDALAATPLAQVSVSAKSPLALMLVKVRAALPVLFTVTI